MFKLLRTTESDSVENNDRYLTPLEQLPNEILIEIFKNLPLSDRITVERVCKNWQIVAKQSWYQLKALCMDPKVLGFKTSIGGARKCFADNYALQQVLNRCGKYISTIDVSMIHYCALSLIAQLCKSLKILYCCNVSARGTYDLSNNCENLEKIVITGTVTDISQISLHQLFSKATKLRDICLQNYVGSGECFTKLPLNQMLSIKIGHIDIDCSTRTISKTKLLKEFACTNVQRGLITTMSNVCVDLTKIDLKADPLINSHDIDSALSCLFNSNKNLRSLTLRSFENMTGHCFFSLNKQVVDEIVLISSENVKKNYLKDSFSSFDKLTKLELRYVNKFKLGRIADCIFECQNLKRLSLDYFRQYSTKSLIKSISNTRELEELELAHFNNSRIEKSFTDYVSFNLEKLKILTLRRCKGLTENHLINICKLTNIQVLDVSGNVNLDGFSFRNFRKLREMYCSYCPCITNDILSKFIQRADNLNVLDIAGCRKITNSSIVVAIQVTTEKRRLLQSKLEIRVRGTGVMSDQIKNTSAFLYIKDT